MVQFGGVSGAIGTTSRSAYGLLVKVRVCWRCMGWIVDKALATRFLLGDNHSS